MAPSPNRPQLEIAPGSVNKVQEVSGYQPNSAIALAAKMLTGVGEETTDIVGMSIIPVDLSTNPSVIIRLRRPVDPSTARAKGLDSHELRIQRLRDTEPSEAVLDRASREGYDTGHDALISLMDGSQQSFFSTDILPSSALIRVRAKSGDLVEVPLFVPVLFFGPSGKKSVAIITRFPQNHIQVETSSSVDRPIGQMDATQNKVVRKVPITPTPTEPQSTSFAWAFPQKPEDETPQVIPTVPVDGQQGTVKIDFVAIEKERLAKIPLENIISGIDRAKKTREAKRLLRVLDDTDATERQRHEALEKWKQDSRFSQLKLDDPTRLFGEIAENIVGYQDIFDKTERINGGWLSYSSGGVFELFAYSWRVDIGAVNRTLEKYLRLYQKRDNPERRKHYVEYTSLKHMVDSEWIADKRWKN